MGNNKTYKDFDVFELALLRESNHRVMSNPGLPLVERNHLAIIYDNSEINHVIKEKLSAMSVDELVYNLNRANNLILNNPDDNAAYVFLSDEIKLQLKIKLEQKFIR